MNNQIVPIDDNFDLISGEIESFEAGLTVEGKALRDDFVTEYIKDFDYDAATVRLGLNKGRSHLFRACPYVAFLVAKFKKTENATNLTDEGLINAVWQMAHDPSGTPSSRLAALRLLMQQRGMLDSEGGIASGNTVNINNGEIINNNMHVEFSESDYASFKEKFSKDY